MKLKTLAAASALALTAVGAQAISTFDGGEHGSFKAAIESPANGGFFNTYAFTLSVASDVTATFAGNGITGFIGLFNANSTPVAGTSWSVGGPTFTTSDSFTLAAGSYFYAVSGLSTSGNYTLTSTAVAAVPEPETYALLGAGLGIVGFVASRRRRDF